MKKIVLIDGNNLMYRSYYATAYTGNIMRNSKGYPTNALYGFVSMLNKIIEEEKPTYMAVAFDIGKNFRHEKYKDYKMGRQETPEELIMQMKKARELLDAMHIKYLEKENYEADDIIGTLVKMCEEDSQFDATIISSDKDLLQLINFETDIKLLKQKGFIRYNEESFFEEYKIKPIRIIDLKALQGDASDNIPGVKGIGEKTALGLLQEYESLENVYDNIDNIKGKLKEKLINDKENAFFSKELATIYKEVPLDIALDDLKYVYTESEELFNIYKDLEFNSLIRNFKNEPKEIKLEYKVVNSLDEVTIDDDYAFYIECDKENYHDAEILGMGVHDGTNTYYIPVNLIKSFLETYENNPKYTYDLKKNIVLLNKLGIYNINVVFDLMMASYLLEISNKDDIAYHMQKDGIIMPLFQDMIKTKFVDLENIVSAKTQFIYNKREDIVKQLKMEDMYDLYVNIEHPLIEVLANMELNGVYVNEHTLIEMKSEIKAKIDILEKKIYNIAGIEFNISSPKQLGEVLFERLNLPYGKKNKKGYSTDANVLNKLRGSHEIIEKILEYRNLSKLYTTYLEGLRPFIKDDGKIHTIYKQNLTRTGRLSSIEPNLQNIPTRDELGRKIRKCFVPSENGIFISADYSQIELRLLAHIANAKELIQAFINGEDIHTKVAADIHGVNQSDVTKEMRKSAKAVIFGIVYGISGFGLSDNLEISYKEADKFINKYYELYPGVKKYMDDVYKEALADGFVKTMFHRKRTIEELQSSVYMIKQQGKRIALNTPIQGTAADIIKKAMVDVYKEMHKRGLSSKLILQVHDELIFDALPKEKDILIDIIKDKMENVIKISVPLKVEISTGDNWYES